MPDSNLFTFNPLNVYSWTRDFLDLSSIYHKPYTLNIMLTYTQQQQQALRDNPKKWLITGVAGFIGSNLLETLLK